MLFTCPWWVAQTEVPKLMRPLLVDPEFSIPRTAEILFSRDASGRRALVYNAFADDAFYYNTFVSLASLRSAFKIPICPRQRPSCLHTCMLQHTMFLAEP